MQLPRKTHSYKAFTRYGKYTAARLRADSRMQLAEDVTTVTEAVKDKGRAWEDAREEEASKIADRDAADDSLDTLTQEVRLELASRDIGADRKLPYTAIFAGGITYYTAAPLSKNAARYRELVIRARESLPSEDTARARIESEIPPLLQAFEQAVSALETTRIAAGVARTNLEAELDAWSVQMERTFGSLTAELGRRKADRFFPSATRSSQEESAPDDDEL